jgi:hypothetical protein
MNNVIQLFTWTLHLSAPDDDFEAACGELDPEILADESEAPLPGYAVCNACKAALTSAS